jgi:hypothetical protein
VQREGSLSDTTEAVQGGGLGDQTAAVAVRQYLGDHP